MFQTLTTAYAAEICPMALRAHLTSFVNICWAMGESHRIQQPDLMLPAADHAQASSLLLPPCGARFRSKATGLGGSCTACNGYVDPHKVPCRSH